MNALRAEVEYVHLRRESIESLARQSGLKRDFIKTNLEQILAL